MYTQTSEEFYAQFPYGLGGAAGFIEGSPGHMSYCSIPSDDKSPAKAVLDGEKLWAGKLPSGDILVVPASEMEAAWLREAAQWSGPVGVSRPDGSYNPIGVHTLVERVDYWMEREGGI